MDAAIDFHAERPPAAAPELGVEVAASTQAVQPGLALWPREIVPSTEPQELHFAEGLRSAFQISEEELKRSPVPNLASLVQLVADLRGPKSPRLHGRHRDAPRSANVAAPGRGIHSGSGK